MTFRPGQSGNPGGRRPGAKNGKNQSDKLAFRAADCKQPDLFLLAVIANEACPVQLRAQAAGMLLPYRCTKPDRKVSRFPKR
jgi:hypothetical protein